MKTSNRIPVGTFLTSDNPTNEPASSLFRLGAHPWIGVAFRAVRFPIKGLQVIEFVAPARSDRFDVVDFPATIRELAVLSETNPVAAGILACHD